MVGSQPSNPIVDSPTPLGNREVGRPIGRVFGVDIAVTVIWEGWGAWIVLAGVGPY